MKYRLDIILFLLIKLYNIMLIIKKINKYILLYIYMRIIQELKYIFICICVITKDGSMAYNIIHELCMKVIYNIVINSRTLDINIMHHYYSRYIYIYIYIYIYRFRYIEYNIEY